MDTIVASREQRAANVQMAKDLVESAQAEKRDLTKEEAKKVDALMSAADKLSEDIYRLEKLEKLQQGLTDPVAEPGAPPPPSQSQPLSLTPRKYRFKKLRAFRNEDDAYRSGMWLRATLFNDRQAQRWVNDFMGAGGENVGTKGGFLVPEEMSRAIIDLREEYGVMRREAGVIAMGSDTITIPKRSSGLTAYYVSENTEVTASDKAWDQVTLVARKLAALHRMSAELSDDAIINLADDIASEMAFSFAEAEDDAGLNGDGTDNYGGIHGVRPKIIDGNHAAGAVDAASGIDTFAEITATDLASVMAACPAYALSNASWYCSQAAFSLVFERLAVAGGGNTIGTFAEPRSFRYLGYPIVISQKMPTSTGDLSNVAMLLFGDMRRAVAFGDRQGFRVLTSNERYMEYDQIGVLGIERYDIKVHSLGDGTTAGPLVALIGE